MNRNPDIVYVTEYIKNVLYFAIVRNGKELQNTSDTHFFSIDNQLVYENYYSDFGPLNLGCVYKYCSLLNEKFKEHLNKHIIVHYTSTDQRKKANAAFLLGCYGVLYLTLTPRDAVKPLLAHNQTYRPFQDATQGDSVFTITILDCVQAIRKARDLGFFNFQDFNYDEYQQFDKIQGGDLNWIVPDKFLAFIGPVDHNVSMYHPPEMYIDYFLSNNVRVVIRLNKRMYDANVFTKAGITHYDLFFPDGSCPPRHILKQFLQISEDTPESIAVHCKAGLGRTGTLIGSYLIKHYRMTAHEAIGWMRICRPGSVIGHQQTWLEQLEAWLTKQGNLYRIRMFRDANRTPIHEYGVYSLVQRSKKHKQYFPSKSPSPPPPMNRKTSNDAGMSTRPRFSKIREAFPSASLYSADVVTPRESARSKSKNTSPNSIKSSRPGSHATSGTGERPRRYIGAGESTTSQHICRKTKRILPKLFQGKNSENPYPYPVGTTRKLKPLPSLQSNLIVKNLHEAKGMWKNYNKLNEVITVTPRLTLETTKNYYKSPCPSPVREPSPVSMIPSTQFRRRLGRSPSPIQKRKTLENTKATNTPLTSSTVTPTIINKHLTKSKSKSTLNDEIPQATEIEDRRKAHFLDYAEEQQKCGPLSVGASSLGARRTAPAPLPAPSVRSDERPLATQGDLLNSIKFQRTFRESLQKEKNKIIKTKLQQLQRPNDLEPGKTREKSISPPRISIASRPMSPKGKRTMHSLNYSNN